MCAMKIFVDPICSRVADPNFKAIPLLIIYNFHPRADSCQQIHSAARPQVRLPSTCPNLGRSVLSVSENRAQSPARLLIFHHLPHYWPFLGRSSSVSNLPAGVVELPLLSDNYPTGNLTWASHISAFGRGESPLNYFRSRILKAVLGTTSSYILNASFIIIQSTCIVMNYYYTHNYRIYVYIYILHYMCIYIYNTYTSLYVSTHL